MGVCHKFHQELSSNSGCHQSFYSLKEPTGSPKALVFCKKEESEVNDWTISWAFPNSVRVGSNTKYSFHKEPVLV